MNKLRIILPIGAASVILIILAVMKPSRVPIVAQLTNQHRPVSKLPTLTSLPEFPGIPLYAQWLSREKKDELIQTLIDNKVSTWPVEIIPQLPGREVHLDRHLRCLSAYRRANRTPGA